MPEFKTDRIHAINCSLCDRVLYPNILKSVAGFYIGYKCRVCGPYSRISGYYPTSGAAEGAAVRGDYGR